MAKRFYSEFNNLRNEHFTIEVWDTDFAGTATTFNPGADGFSISYKGDNQERTGTVIATECSVAFRVETADHETFLTDIIASKESRFTLKITKGTGTPTLFWVGLIITDIGGLNEEYNPFFTIKAVDGLGLLKDVEYMDGVNFYTGKETLKQQLVNALTKLEYVDTHFATTERFLRIGVDWWEETMTNNSTNDPLALTYTDQAVWLTYKKNVTEARSCYEVIDNIMRCFGARITQHEGVFWVEQITYRTASTIVLRSYDKAGTYLSSNNFSDQNVINQTANGALFTGGVYEFFAPLSEARHTFNLNLRTNLLAGQTFSTGVVSNVTVNRAIDANGGATTLRLTGNIVINIYNTTYSGNLNTPRFAIFKCQLKIGSYYLKRGYTSQNYQVAFGAMSWETSANFFYLAVEMPNGVPTIGNVYNYSQLQDITTPPLPSAASAGSFEFGIIWDTLTLGGLSDFTESFNFLKQYLEAFSFGNPVLNDDAWEYETLNPDVENTLIHETECLIGNSDNPNAVGALWVKPAADYVLADDWGDGADTPDRDIEKLNIELVVGGQQTPIRRLSGTLYGPLTLLGRVVWQSTNWLLLGGTYNAAGAQMQGEWFELNYDGAGLSTSGPIRYKKQGIPGLPEAPPDDPGSGNSTGKNVYNLPAAAPGTLLYPVAVARTLDEISPGVITSVDITSTLEDDDFVDGDFIVLLNPMTGFFEELEVTVSSNTGDDHITVLGTLVGSYPPDTPVIKKADVSSYELPPGDVGEILRHTGLRWRAYAGVTDGHVLTWDTTNGWQAEAPAGGTVTSVALTMPTDIFDVAGSPVTTSGTLAVTLDNQTANTVFAGPTSGGAAAPAFRALVAGDIPAVNSSAITGLTANQVLYGGGGGGIAQSANFTFDGAKITYTNTASTSSSYDAFLQSGTLTSTGNSVTTTHQRLAFTSENDGSVTGNSQYGIIVGHTISALTQSSGAFGLFSTLTNNSGAASGQMTSMFFRVTENEDTTTFNNRIGCRGEVLFTGTNDLHTATGLRADLTATGSGRWNVGIGVYSNLTNVKTAYGMDILMTNSRSTANIQRGIRIQNNVSGSGVVVSDVYGIQLLSSASSSGVITNYYGIHQNTIPSGATQTYFLYGSQSAAKSYFAGNVGIGSGTTTPAQSLHVAGTMRLTGSDGTSTTIMGRDADGDVSAITVSTGLSLAGNVLTATGGGTNYQTFRDDGSDMTQRAAANFVSGSVISFTLADDAGNNETEVTAGVVTNSISNSLFRQSAGLSVVGRSANTTGDVADITAASDFQVLRRSGTAVGFGSINLASTNAVTGTLPVGNGGTGAATLANDSVLTGNGTSAIVAETNLTFNSSGQLTIGSGTAAAFLNVFTGALSGTQEFIRMSGNINGNMVMSHLNASNASTSANSLYQISVGGSSAGDPVIQLTVSGVVSHAIGVDNSDGDKIKITPGQALPGGVANRGLIITNAATSLVGVNKDAPVQALDVTGRVKGDQIVMTQQNPSASLGTGAGSTTGGTVNSIIGGPNGFQIDFTTGTTPVTNGVAFLVTLGTAFPAQHFFLAGARNAQAATDLNKFFINSFSTTQIGVNVNGTLAASTQYVMNWVGIGY